MSTTYTISQSVRSAPYSAQPSVTSPIWLIVKDIWLVFQPRVPLLGVVRPLMPWQSGQLDELYPSYRNLKDVFIHSILLLAQGSFILLLLLCVLLLVSSIFFFIFIFPTVICFGLVCIYCPVLVIVNSALCGLLDGPHNKPVQKGTPPGGKLLDNNEKWFFINGISTGYGGPSVFLYPSKIRP